VYACIFVAVIRHADRTFMRHITLSSVACFVLPYFSTLFNKQHDIRKKKNVIEYKIRVMILSTTLKHFSL